MKKLLSVLLMCSAFLSFAQTKKAPSKSVPAFVTKVENISEYRMDNGMQVLLIPDATQNNVVVNIVYKVGSRHEGYGETGMAHLLEHMLFKGTKRIREIKKAIADKGAEANGTTWYDRTNYYEILPATDDNLKWALDMEADRMVNSTILKEDLAKEFSVVRNEFESGENYPSRVLFGRVVSTMYLWHNYGKSTIGSKEDIERVPVENLKEFYKKYYQPDNAVLIVAGKFDKDKTLQWIGDYFSPIPRPARVLQPAYTVEPTQDGERTVELRRNGDIQYLAMAFHTPAAASEDYVANAALIETLINEPSGYLYKALIETKKATKVYAYCMPLYDPGFSYYEAEVPNDKSMKDAKKAFINAMNGLDTVNFTEEDLTRAKNVLIKANDDIYNNTIYFAISLTEFIGGGDYRMWHIIRDRIEKLTLADLNAAKKYYKSSNRTVGVFTPDKAPVRVQVAPTPDIAAMTKGYKGKEVTETTETFEPSIPNIKSKTVYGTLANGMKYAILRKPTKGDKITGTMMLKVGDEKSLSGKTSVAYLTARMLKYGTKNRSRKEIADQLDKIKTSIYFYAGSDAVNAYITTDKENFSAAMDLMQDMLLNPTFDEKEYDKLILDAKADLESSMSDPGSVSSEVLLKKMNLYPDGHPYHPQTSAEQLVEIQKVKLDDIKAYYKEFYGANNGFVTFVGGLDENSVKKALTGSYSNWNSKAVYKDIEEKYFDVKGGLETVQINDKTNAVLQGGLNINMTQQSPDYVALMMANEMLGGGSFMSSRISQRLRENEGMSYGAGSYYSADYNYPSGSWGVYAIFNPTYKDKLNGALDEEVRKALEKGFTEQEWQTSLKSWLQSRKIYLDDNGSVADLLNTYMEKGKQLDFYTDMETKAKALNVNQINSTMKKYIDPAKIILIYAGDFTKK